jgi:hypothetical protein
VVQVVGLIFGHCTSWIVEEDDSRGWGFDYRWGWAWNVKASPCYRYVEARDEDVY